MGKSKNKRKRGKQKGQVKKYAGPKFSEEQLRKRVPMTSTEKKEREIENTERQYQEIVNQLNENQLAYRERFVNLRTTAALEAIKLGKSVKEAVGYGTEFANELRETDQEFNEFIRDRYIDSEVLLKHRDMLVEKLQLIAPEKYGTEEEKVTTLEVETENVEDEES
jgi:hypothetical protein